MIKFGHGWIIFGRVMPLSLWQKREIFSFMISCSWSPQQLMYNIQLKFNIILWIFHSNTQVRFEFGHGSKIFFTELSLLNLSKIRFFYFPFIISPTVVHIQLRYIWGICRPSLNLIMVQRFWTKLSLLNVRKYLNFYLYKAEILCADI
jgi:hypothetical protein